MKTGDRLHMILVVGLAFYSMATYRRKSVPVVGANLSISIVLLFCKHLLSAYAVDFLISALLCCTQIVKRTVRGRYS